MANAASNRMTFLTFAIGDTVVLPQYGVGHIDRLEEREFERGKIHTYYTISMSGGSIVWVPVDRKDSTLRHVAEKSELAHCREILEAPPLTLTEDGRVRQSELIDRLKGATIVAQCEVVRDLSAFLAKRSSYGAIRGFLESIQHALYEEWALVAEISTMDAQVEIISLLEKPAQVSG